MDFNKIKSDLKKEDGVSPVVGVILMVAIVVLLAAIVAAFVFGVVTIPSPTPQASLAVDDATWEDEKLNVTLLHQSGSTLDALDTKIVITDLNNTDNVNTTTLSDWSNVEDDWSTGERINITIEDDDFKDYPDEIEVRVIDEPSGGTISVMTSTVTEL
ncbi:Pilin/Flagellin PilA family [Methanonatronarchaeum thermophilum]|uniref:Pilin/Flagellin PilA family n=1 Tax=Methanonatronarchaeum thermophilum TaxID=1927129 RepID=A0A1Y3GAC1_9EURY|nr:type IV pilin N-terminal domain-containing protein [Methanonatronarchaeum thermophilum]OUJ18392.1 Pilin/Flagellin PilA family [Methanonatronarchaeum thermophilum]